MLGDQALWSLHWFRSYSQDVSTFFLEIMMFTWVRFDQLSMMPVLNVHSFSQTSLIMGTYVNTVTLFHNAAFFPLGSVSKASKQGA